MAEPSQYPADFNPPTRGVCEVCGCETRAWAVFWLKRCPKHWQALVAR